MWWKNTQVLTNYPISYFPSPGRLLMAARVGGNTANIAMDNIALVTYPATHLIIGGFAATPIGVSAEIGNSGASLADTNTIMLSSTATPSRPPGDQGGTVTTMAWWDANTPFAPGSTLTVGLRSMTPPTSGPYTNSLQVVRLPLISVLTPAMAVTNVDTTQPGFNVTRYQVSYNTVQFRPRALRHDPLAPGMETSIRRAEEELAGMLGANDPPSTARSRPAPSIQYQEQQLPRKAISPSTTATLRRQTVPRPRQLPYDEQQINNFAYEFKTIIYFPETGLYNITFNSDDGFRMTVGNPAKDVFNSLLIGQYDGGRGSSDSTSEVYVQKPGYYPFRTMYFNGNGGANAEWSGHELFPPSPPIRSINDVTSPTALLSYRTATSSHPAAVAFTDPVVNSGTYGPTWPMEGPNRRRFGRGDQRAYPLSEWHSGNGLHQQERHMTTLSYTPATMLASGSANMMGISFKDGSGAMHSNAVPFNVVSYTVVPPSMALTPGECGHDPERVRCLHLQVRGFRGLLDANTGCRTASLSRRWRTTVSWAGPTRPISP